MCETNGLMCKTSMAGGNTHGAAGSHTPAAAQAAEAEAPKGTQKKGGKPSETQANVCFANFLDFFKGLAKAKCPQMICLNYLSTSQESGLAIPKVQYGNILINRDVSYGVFV